MQRIGNMLFGSMEGMEEETEGLSQVVVLLQYVFVILPPMACTQDTDQHAYNYMYWYLSV